MTLAVAIAIGVAFGEIAHTSLRYAVEYWAMKKVLKKQRAHMDSYVKVLEDQLLDEKMLGGAYAGSEGITH